MVAPLNTMLVKTVATTLATDSAGNTVEAIPVYLSDVPVANSAGVIVAPTQMVESAVGVPIRIVPGLAATNAAGKVVGATVGTGLYQPEALALFARFTTPPAAARKTLINNLIVSLKTAGVWSKLDAFYMLAAADAQSSLLNWVSTSYNLTAVNSPAFVVNQGYTGDGSTSYLDTEFNPTTAPSPKFVQDSGAMVLWSRTNLANGGAQSSDFGSANSYIGRSGSTSGLAIGRPSAGSAVNIATGAYPGFVSFSRTAAAVWEGYAQGVDAGGGTTASAALTNATIRIGSIGALFGVNQHAAAGIAGGLSAAEELATYNAINTYLQAIGAA